MVEDIIFHLSRGELPDIIEHLHQLQYTGQCIRASRRIMKVAIGKAVKGIRDRELESCNLPGISP